MSGGATTYYQKDHLSVRMMTDASGNVLGQEGHFPFGEAWYSSSGNSEWVFTTYQHNQETGLEYAMARYYDPRTATFCSADPVEGDPSDPESWNRYVYVRDNPIDITDPSGQSWFTSYFGWIAGIFKKIFLAVAPAIAAPYAIAALADLTADIPVIGDITSAAESTQEVYVGNDQFEFVPNGEFSAGGEALAQAAQSQQKRTQNQSRQSKFNPCNNKQAVNFIKAHEADATTLASDLKVPANYVLAVAGDESSYGTSRIAIGANNYFGLHAGAPGSTGPWSGNPIVAAFPQSGGFMASGQSFVQLASPLLGGLKGSISPRSFFTALHAKWGVGTRNYVGKMTGEAELAKARADCP